MGDWDAGTYSRVSAPQRVWGPKVMARLDLRGDEAVLDAGCGSGEVTRELAARVPRGRVVAVDGSAAMAARAAEALADLAPRVRVLHMDLLDLELPGPVDAVFSSAVFHWIGDHERLFARLAAALAPGGRLVAQCGGHGNVARVFAAAAEVAAEHPYAEPLGGFHESVNFATPEATEARLAAAGFAGVRAWLAPDDVLLPAGEEAERYLATVVLREHVALLPEPLRAGFTRAVAARLIEAGGAVSLDYVRLNIDAARG
jgi:trans-aconitate 2-methyltransferase